MPALVDAATLLIPAGVIATSQDFPALALAVRQLGTSAWVVQMTTPPAAAATFTLAVASVAAGPYSTIATLVWPAGQVGSRQVSLGVQGNMAAVANSTSAWVRASVVTTGALTLGGSWLTRPSGAVGLASRRLA